MRYWNNTDLHGDNMATSLEATLELCMEKCLSNMACQSFTYDHWNRHDTINCWLKTTVPNYIDAVFCCLELCIRLFLIFGESKNLFKSGDNSLQNFAR